MPLGDRILRLRRERTWNQLQLAKASGVPQSTISKLEAGEITGVRPETLQGLAGALGVAVDFLIGRSTKRVPNRSGEDSQLKKLREVWEDLTPIERRELLAFAQGWTKRAPEGPQRSEGKGSARLPPVPHRDKRRP